MRRLFLLALLSSPLAAHAQISPATNPAPAPTAVNANAAPALGADEIARRASARLENKPAKLTCTVEIDAAQIDSEGKPVETHSELLEETWDHGKAEQGLPAQISVDGKPLTGDDFKKAIDEEKTKRAEMKEHEEKNEGGDVQAPFAKEQLAHHKFTLLRQEQLDGRPAYVLGVAPLENKRDDLRVTREGTAWIDAESFVPLRIESHASPLPKHVDKMEFLEEFAPTAQGETAPRSLRIEVKGGILFFTKTFRVSTRWRGCK